MAGNNNLHIINYPAPCYPFGFRYHPTHTYTFPYKVQAFAYTDRLHGKSAIYYPDRDKTGVIEITAFKDGSPLAPVKKRFHIDHSTWYEADLGDVVAMDMAFGYDYQRLYILFKQNLSNGKTYRAWLSMYDTNKPSDTIFDHSWGIPMYGFIKDMVHLHPFSPENLDTVLDYIKVCGMTGDLIQRPELDPTFNLLCAHDKIFITLPVMFKPRTMPWDKETEWTVRDARCLYQVLFMFDETAAIFNSAAIIGALSTWPEGWETPIPDIFPRQPFKTRMFFMDDCIGWQLNHARVFPKEWYTDGPTRFNNYNIWYLKGEWDGANVADHYWQPLTTETIHIDEFISTLTEQGSSYLKPITFRAQQYYGQTPLVFDLYSKAASDWSFQRVYGSWDRYIQEYEVKYHNFKRKILTGFEVETTSVRTDYTLDKITFLPISGSNTSLDSHAQVLDLKSGHYKVEMRGADGGPSRYVNDVPPASYPSSGGAGASVSFEFDIEGNYQAQIYAGHAGSVGDGGSYGGGSAGTFPANPVDPGAVESIETFLKNKDIVYRDPGIVGECYFFLISQGYKHIRLVLADICYNHNISLQVFDLNGHLLTGSPATRYPSTANANYENMWYSYLEANSSSTPSKPPSANVVTQVLKAKFPSTIPDTFSFDDTQVNGTGSDAPYTTPTINSVQLPVKPYTPGSLPRYTVHGESIEWSGNVIGSNVNVPRYPNNGVYEELYIDTANTDLIVGLVGIHHWRLYAEWDPPTPPEPDPDVTGGGGGGFTGFFLNGVPIGIAGSGGGAGSSFKTGDTTGGNGGAIAGSWGQLDNIDTQAPGTQDSGYSLFRGQSAPPTENSSGGGGAGLYGGTASGITGFKNSPGGGGGSSFILGGEGYSANYTYPEVVISNAVVTPGTGTPGVNPRDGWVTIEGSYYEIKNIYTPIYSFLDHELGDFYYQCAGKYITPDRMPVPPAPPPSPVIFEWRFSECVQPEPITDPGVPVTPIPYFEYTPPKPPLPDLDIMFLADMTASMDSLVATIGGSMKAFVDKMNARGFVNSQYAFGVFNNENIQHIPMSDGSVFTKDGLELQKAFDKARAVAGKAGGRECGGQAILNMYNAAKPTMINPNGSPGQQDKLVHFVMITDEPCADSGADIDAQAINLATSLNAGIHWVLPEGYGDYYKDTPFIGATVNAVNASLIPVMRTSGSWGNEAAEYIIQSIESTIQIVTDDTTYRDWVHKFPGLPSLNLAAPSGGMIKQHTAFYKDPPGPDERPVIPGYTVYHTFAIENLACHAYMVDVRLRSKSDKLKLGYLSDYDPNRPDPILPPTRDELSWDEIPPHSEALFTVYTEMDCCSLEDMLDFQYYLELRDS